MTPKVSILLLVYNHAKFLRTCLDSALSQETNFEYEIIIGDDCSDDGSSDIVKEYAALHKDKIRPFIHKKRFGGAGVPNLIEITQYAKGSYFLILEGDDYYMHPQKLQKQVDFLDKNPEFSICFHNARVFYDDGSLPEYQLNDNIEKDIFEVDDLVGEQEIWFMATASIMYRKSAFTGYPKWFYESKSGDIPMQIMVARNGKIKYLDELMSAYRKHAGGTSFSDKYNDAGFLQNRINMYHNLDLYLDKRLHNRFNRLKSWYYRFMIDSKQAQQNYFKRITWLLHYFYLAGFPSGNRKLLIVNYAIPKPLLNIYTNIRSKK
jgi:glycosyltransferase involved in cell wall biosynthesis